jgi:hypothetical protein
MARIKDINNDGKRNFKDTYIGEKLTGSKTKGPNMKESMAGARRESLAPTTSPRPPKRPDASASKAASQSAPTTSPFPPKRPDAPAPTTTTTPAPTTTTTPPKSNGTDGFIPGYFVGTGVGVGATLAGQAVVNKMKQNRGAKAAKLAAASNAAALPRSSG